MPNLSFEAEYAMDIHTYHIITRRYRCIKFLTSFLYPLFEKLFCKIILHKKNPLFKKLCFSSLYYLISQGKEINPKTRHAKKKTKNIKKEAGCLAHHHKKNTKNSRIQNKQVLSIFNS